MGVKNKWDEVGGPMDKSKLVFPKFKWSQNYMVAFVKKHSPESYFETPAEMAWGT